MTGETKVCIKCGMEKPLDEFDKAKQNKDGHINTCKVCVHEYYKEHYVSIKKTVIYDSDITSKICNKCGEEKDLSEFNKAKLNKDGYKNTCKVCLNEYKKIRYKIKMSNMSDVDKIKKKEKDKILREKYSDSIHKANKRYYDKNSEIINEKGKKYKIYANRRDYWLKYKKEQRLNNPCFKLHYNLRSSIISAIKRGGYVKNSHTEEILGITIEEFKEYIESKFECWMNWENYGNWDGIPVKPNHSWDIDHRIPLSTAKTEEDIIRLNHYTNLQPLCSYVNRYIKKDKILI